MRRFFPFTDLRDYQSNHLGRDILAALSVTLLAIPQGVAYAMIAGLPPVMGLYACGVPVIVGCMLRSSRHVVTGPSNALSLLVGGGLLVVGGENPIAAAITLAFMVGIFQLAAGVLRLGGIVDYISQPVVLGYVVGAGVLIGAGQLPNATGVANAASGNLYERVLDWWGKVPDIQLVTVGIAFATVVVLLIVRRLSRRFPAAVVAIGLTAGCSWLFDLSSHGVKVVADLASVPGSFFSLSLPDLGMIQILLPLSVACTVLSLVESSAVARTVASESGQILDSNTEFFGQGAANLTASFLSGYPISGSLARSSLNAKSGAQSRLAGAMSGVLVLGSLPVMAPVLNVVPLGALAGLILVVAADLIQVRRMRQVMRGPLADGLAMIATMFGTWFLSLDNAIYLGVGISLILFLRRVRLLRIREMVVTEKLRIQEVDTGDARGCSAVKILHIEGNLFFGSAGELCAALESARLEPGVQGLVVRMKRTAGLDSTTAQVLVEVAVRMRESGQVLVLVGLREEEMRWLDAAGILRSLGEENVIPTQKQWFEALHGGIRLALNHVEEHHCESCPLEQYLGHVRR